jgi:branched-chain amino acid transport system ATP-binding protein
MREVFAIFPQIAQRKNTDAGYLSGGEKQMLAIGRALMLRPKLLLLDEPSLGLSRKIVGNIFETLQKISKQFNTSVLIAEQNVKAVLTIADLTYALRLGEVVLRDKTSELTQETIRNAFLGN